MDDHELEILIYRIISGYQYIKLNNNLYKLVSPSIDLKIAANILYNDIYQENLYGKFILKENLKELLISNQIISETFDADLYTTEKRLNAAKIQYYKQFYTQQKKSNKNKIISLSKTISNAYNKKRCLDFLTLENYCENIKNEFIISKTLYDESNNLVFRDYSNIDYVFFNKITLTIADNLINIDTYKKIARSDYWKKISSSNRSNIFRGPSSEYSEEQKALLSITDMYTRVYEHPDAPDEEIINDDDALDGWMLEMQEKITRSKKQKGIDNTLSKGSDSPEVYVMTDKQNLNKVMELNSPEALKIVKSRTAIKPGEVKQDADFDDTKEQIRQQINDLNMKGK